MIARKHHYVPQCYLKGFSINRNNPKLYVVDINERRAFTTAPTNIAAERDFHKIDLDNVPSDAVENSLAQFESELSKALGRIISSYSISDKNDRALLFNLLGLLAVKTPRLLEMMRDLDERMAKVIGDLVTSTPEIWESQINQAKANGFIKNDADTSREKMKEFLRRGEWKVEVDPGQHLHREFKTFDKILPYIFCRKWVLLKAPPDTTGFISSDHPMCLMWSDPKRYNSIGGPGLGLLDTNIIFPVSNELALVGAIEGDEVGLEASEMQISAINGIIIMNAERQVYARDSDFAYVINSNGKIMRGDSLHSDSCCVRPHTHNK